MFQKNYRCFRCSTEYDLNNEVFICPKCGYSLIIEYDLDRIRKNLNIKEFRKEPISHWKYKMFYPTKGINKIITMAEGNTPIIKSKNNKNLYYKIESMNPTGSFKDRGSSLEITKALSLGKKEVYCASTGNMGASIAAYAARVNMKAHIFAPPVASKNKINQIKGYNGEIKIISGNYTDALNETLKIKNKKDIYLVGDYPYRCEGTKSVGFEIAEQFNFKVPENIICPIGNGILIYAVFKAFSEFKAVGLTNKIPKIYGVQALGCDPVCEAFKKQLAEVKGHKKSNTIASAIDCPDPVSGNEALYAVESSHGKIIEVSDEEIITAMKDLGKEGIFCEGSSAATFAGYKKLKEKLKGATVLIITGHGLKESKYYFN